MPKQKYYQQALKNRELAPVSTKEQCNVIDFENTNKHCRRTHRIPQKIDIYFLQKFNIGQTKIKLMSQLRPQNHCTIPKSKKRTKSRESEGMDVTNILNNQAKLNHYPFHIIYLDIIKAQANSQHWGHGCVL